MRNWFPSPPHISLTITILLFCAIQRISSQGKYGNGDPITPKHLELLEKFKVTAKDVVYLDYQKKDSFLLIWLRASDFDVENAQRRLAKSMEWRKQNRIDTLSENPEIHKYKKMYKYTVDGVDRQGRRILEFNPGRWDARKISLSGRGKMMQLYWSYMYETAMDLTWGTGDHKVVNGKNVTEFLLLMDASGFTLRTHACLACLAVLGGIVQDMENNYAGFIYPFIMANVPRGFDIILDFIKPLISSSTRRGLVVLTNDPNELKKYFDTIIDPDQLGRQYGGTRSMIRGIRKS